MNQSKNQTLETVVAFNYDKYSDDLRHCVRVSVQRCLNNLVDIHSDISFVLKSISCEMPTVGSEYPIVAGDVTAFSGMLADVLRIYNSLHYYRKAIETYEESQKETQEE